MSAKFEIDFQEALRNVAALQAAIGNVGKHLDDLNRTAGKRSTGLTQMVSTTTKFYDELGRAMAATSKEAQKNGEAISTAMVKAERATHTALDAIIKANHRATLAASAYKGEMTELQRVMINTAQNRIYVQAMEKIATLQHKITAENTVMKASLEALNTAEGKRSAIIKERLASEQKMAGAATRQIQQAKELQQALELQASATGKANAVQKARLDSLVREQQEEARQIAKLGELNRAYQSLNGGVAAQIQVQQQLNNALVQAATFREREANQLAELRRRQESLNGGVAEQIANIKAQNQAREQLVTTLAREMAQIDQLRNKLASLNGGQQEQITRLQEQVKARTQQIQSEERYTASLTQTTTAQAKLQAQDEARLATMNAKNSATLAAARAQQTLTSQDAKNIALAEKMTADTAKRNAALLDQARAAHGMSAAQKELNAVQEREAATLAKLVQQRDGLNSAYGRSLAAVRAQIKEQERLNQISTMSTSQLLGFTRAQERHNSTLNVGSQSAAALRAALSGLHANIGMYTSSTILAASATYAVFNAMRSAVEVGTEFTASMAKANAIMNAGTGAQGVDAMRAMEMQVRALGQSTIFTASEVAGGLIELGQAGLSSTEAIMALRPALDLAQIGSLSMAESADIATNVMMIFGKKAEDLTGIVDLMATAATDSNATVQSLANTLTYAGPAAHAAGISLEETAAAAMVLHNAGIKTSRAGTALRKLFTSLLNPTEKGAAVLERYAIATQNADGSTRGLAEILKSLNSALNQATVSEAERLSAIQDLVGLYATSSVAALVEQANGVDVALYTMENKVKGSAQRMRETMADSFKTDWKTTLSAYEELQLQAFDKFEAYLRYTSARASKYLLDMTKAQKVILTQFGTEVGLDQMVSMANLNSAATGTSFSVQTSATGKRTAVNERGDQINAAELVANMDKLTQSQLAVITDLDVMIEKFKTFGETAGYVIAGMLAAKGFGALRGGFNNLAEDTAKASARFTELGARANASAQALGATAVISGQTNRGLALMYGTMAVGARTTGLAMTALTGLSTAMGYVAAAGRAMMAAFGWISIIGSIGYAIYTAFSKDNEAAIVGQGEEIKSLEEKYKALNKEISDFSISKEKEAMRESLKTEKDRLKTAEELNAKLKIQRQALIDAGVAASQIPRELNMEIQITEDSMAKSQAAINQFNKQISEMGQTPIDQKNRSDEARKLADEQIAQVARVKAAEAERDKSVGDSWDAKNALYIEELAQLDAVNAKIKEQVGALNAVAHSAIGAQQVVASAFAGVNAAIMKAATKELTPGEEFDLYSKQVVKLGRELQQMEKDGVGANLIESKGKELAAAAAAQTTASMKLNETRKSLEESQTALATAGQKPAENIALLTKNTKDLQAELALIKEQAASGFLDPGQALERELDVTKRLTTAKNAQLSAQKSIDSANKSANRRTEAERLNEQLDDYIAKQRIATQAANDSAAAYDSGSAAVLQYKINQEIANQEVKYGTARHEELKKAVTDAFTAKDNEKLKEYMYNQRQETADIVAQAKAVIGGEKALRAYSVAKQVETALEGKSSAAKAANRKEIEKQAEAAQKAAEDLEKAQRGMDLSKEFNKGREFTKQYTKDIEALTHVFDQGGISTEEYRRALKGISDAYQDNQASLTVWGRLTTEALDRIDSSFVDMWKNIGGGFEDFKTSLLDSFKQMLAEMAHAAITKPIMISFGNMLLGTNKSGGIGDTLSGLFGSSGAGGGGGGGLTSGGVLGIGKALYQGYSMITGVGAELAAGYASGGVTGALSAGGNYYLSLAGKILPTLSSGFSSIVSAITGSSAANAAATAASQAAVNAAIQAGVAEGAANLSVNAGLSLGQVGVTAAADAGIGVGTETAAASAGASTAAMGVLAVLMGMYQSGKLYDAGVRYDTSEMQTSDLSKVGRALPGPVGFDRALTFASIGLADRTLSKVFGGKMGAILSGSTLAFAVEKFIGEKLFGTDWATKDVGMALSVTDGKFLPEDFQYQKKKGGLFGKNKKRFLYGEMQDKELAQSLGDAYNATVSSAMGLFNSLNVELNENVLDKLNVERMNISTLGRTQEEIQEDINKWFAGLGDSAVAAITEATDSDLKGLNFANLQTFVNNLYGVNDIIKHLGIGLFDVSVAGGHMTEQLQAMAGGMENLQSMVATYQQSFFSETELANNALEDVHEQFSALNLTLPDNRDGFRAMVEGIDKSTEAGRAMFVTLMNLVPAANTAFDVLDSRLAVQSRFNELFMSDTQKTNDALATAYGQFFELGKIMPQSRDGYVRLVKSIDQSNEAGVRLAQSLMGLAESADAAYTLIERQASAERALVVEARQAAEAAKAEEQAALVKAYEEGTEAFNTLLQSMLAAGDVAGYVATQMSRWMADPSGFGPNGRQLPIWGKDGVNTANDFNYRAGELEWMARREYNNEVSRNALRMQNAGIVATPTSLLQYDPVFNTRHTATQDWIGQQVGEVDASGNRTGYAVRDAMSAAVEYTVAQGMRRQYGSTATGLADLFNKRQDLSLAQSNSDVKIYEDTLSRLDAGYREGTITAEGYGKAVDILNTSMADAAYYSENLAAQAIRLAQAQEAYGQAGVRSVNYYFGQMSAWAEELRIAAEEANDPLAQVARVIGQMNSAATAFGQSAAAAGTLTDGRGSKAASQSQLVADAAALASSLITTRAAAEAAKLLAKEPAFADLSAAGIRDAALLLGDIGAYDVENYQKAFVRITAALGEGKITEDQFKALFNTASDLFEGTAKGLSDEAQKVVDGFEAVRKAAKSLADELLVGEKSSLSNQQRYDEVQRQYQAVYDKALTGDADAAGELSGVTNTLLDLAKLNALSAVEYNRIFGLTITDLRKLEALQATGLPTSGRLPVPGFASGGYFSGGLRAVGEQGMELEVTGPSRIIKHSDTMAFLNRPDRTGELIDEVKDLNKRLDVAMKEIIRLNKRISDNSNILVETAMAGSSE